MHRVFDASCGCFRLGDCEAIPCEHGIGCRVGQASALGNPYGSPRRHRACKYINSSVECSTRIRSSAISWELGRHSVETVRGRGASQETRHHAGVAHHNTMRSRVGTRARKLDCHELWSLVVSSLNEKRFLRQIAGRQRMIFPNRPELWASHGKNYQALYSQSRGSCGTN